MDTSTPSDVVAQKESPLFPSRPEKMMRIVTTENGPDMLTPFDAVSAFILDFALLETGKAPSALLLVNEKPDGNGTAYLTLQTLQVP